MQDQFEFELIESRPMSAWVPIVAASIKRSVAVSSAPHAMTVLNSCAIRSAASFNLTKVRPLAHHFVPRSSGSTCSSPAQTEPPRPAFRERIEGVLFAGFGNAVPREVIIESVHAVAEDSMGLKLVCFYPGNAGTSVPTHTAMILLFRPETGEPLAVMDGRLITEMRTAAVSAAVTKRLAAADSRVLALLAVGCR